MKSHGGTSHLKTASSHVSATSTIAKQWRYTPTPYSTKYTKIKRHSETVFGRVLLYQSQNLLQKTLKEETRNAL